VTTYDAILPAGGTIDPAFAAKVDTSNKALIRFGENTILQQTIESLRASGRVGRIVVIGTPEVLASEAVKGADHTLEAGGSGPENILKGLKFLVGQPNAPEKVMIVTTDMPFLSPQVVSSFIDLCPKDKHICVPLVTKADYQARFPDSTSTFVPLQDNVWTVGGAYVMDSQAFQTSLPHIEKVFANRKSKLGMAKLLGPLFLYKFLRKKLTVADIEGKIQGMLGCTGCAVLNSPPELAYDIDYLDDYEYALQHANAPTSA